MLATRARRNILATRAQRIGHKNWYRRHMGSATMDKGYDLHPVRQDGDSPLWAQAGTSQKFSTPGI